VPNNITYIVRTFLQHSTHAVYLQLRTFWDSIRHFRPSNYSTLFTTLSSIYLNTWEWRLLFSKSSCSEICELEKSKRFRVLTVCCFLVTRHGNSAWALLTESEERPGRKGNSKAVSTKDMHTLPRIQARLLFTVYVYHFYCKSSFSCQEYGYQGKHQQRLQE
jgi:hypothetical protein